MKRSKQQSDINMLDALSVVLERVTELEPTDEELALSADLEYFAQREGVALDSGESQLCAIMACRDIAKLATGDKRAIAAIEAVVSRSTLLDCAAGRLVCLEQLTQRALSEQNFSSIRDAICARPRADRTLSTCFGCSRQTAPSLSTIREGLSSYIRDLRGRAPTALSPD